MRQRLISAFLILGGVLMIGFGAISARAAGPSGVLAQIPPRPTVEPLPTDTPVPPTATPIPTDTPVPTATPVQPTAAVPPTETPIPPTSAPPPTETPVLPTKTPVPPTEEPTAVPDPTATSAPVHPTAPPPTNVPAVGGVVPLDTLPVTGGNAETGWIWIVAGASLMLLGLALWRLQRRSFLTR